MSGGKKAGKFASARNIPAMFLEAAAVGGDSPRYMKKVDGAYRETSWAQCRKNVVEIASGLIELGLAVDDRVAILSATRPEWMEVDLGALAAGCVTVPIYPSNLAEECGYIMLDSGARTVVVETPKQAEKIFKVAKDGIELDGTRRDVAVENVIIIDGSIEGATTLSELRERGRASLDTNQAVIEERVAGISPDDLATIVYTSGTTGLPKGVMQTHNNHLSAIRALDDLGVALRGDVDFSFLPLAHSFGRMLEYLGILIGTVTAYAESIDTLVDDIALARPHLLPSVPRIYEKLFAAVMGTRESAGLVQGVVFDWAVGVGGERAAYLNRGEEPPMLVRAADTLAHALVFDKVHQRLGGRIKYLMSGGAPLSPEIAEFFHAVGLPVLEGYGLTETTPILTCNRPGQVRIGTVGAALPGITLKIAEDGEILAKGPNVASGYYNRPKETAEAWDPEGWFHTGDIGELEDDILKITDRKKELIKTSGGKYVAPAKIENMLKAKPLISQAVLIGDRLKYCVALLTLDADELRQWARHKGLGSDEVSELVANEEVVSTVDREVQEVNTKLASFESVKYFRILPTEFSTETGELTPSLKIKRRVIAEKYADEIASMV